MELINKDTPQVKEFISSLYSMLSGIESIVKHYKPHLNGERFLSNPVSYTHLDVYKRQEVYQDVSTARLPPSR